MKKLFYRVCSSVALVCAITFIINTAYMNVSYGKNYDGDYTEKFLDISEGIQISNTGSSHGLRAFNYDKNKRYKCFNFALVSQSLSYDYRLVLHYSDKLKDGGVMFIPVSYFSFYGSDEITETDFKAKDKRYYKILPPNMIKGYDAKTDFFVNYFPSMSAYEKLLMPFVGVELEYDEMSQKVEDLGLNANELSEMGYSRAKYHILEDKIDDNGERIINYGEINACYDIIDLCKSKNIRPIMITTPYLYEYTSAVREIDSDFMIDFMTIIDEIQIETGTEYYDYSEDKRFADHYELFCDMDHLNNEGAEKFTTMIINELVEERKD